MPGTSGSSLDIAAGTPTPLVGTQPLDLHTFPWLCKTCLPGTGPLAPIAHLPRSILYNPGTPAPGRPADPRGPRVWIGAEAVLDLVAGTPFGNQGNHYLDALAFTAAGLPAQPAVVPGTVFRDVLIEPPVVSGSTAWGFKSVYEPVVSFLLTPSATLGWPGRPLCTSGATGPCITASGAPASGANAVYLFNLDWRAGLDGTGGRSAEQDRLAAFVDSVLARPDVPVKRVVLITHSYGGPVARTYYLDPKNGANAKVDQMISFGGGFGGVIEPFDILERGSTWGFGVSFPGVSLGFAEWETKALAQNWPTAYMQQPNSEDWFADHGSAIGGQLVNRSFVRDHRLLGAGELTSWAASMSWVRSRHNAILTDSQTTFFASPALPVSLGDFRGGTGAIYHHRIIGHGRMDTKVATVVVHLPSLAASLPLGALNPVEWWPTEWSWPVYGDGDSTIPYHGALGLTDPRDDRIYIIEKVVHSDLPNVPQVVGAPGSPSVKGLLQLLLEGATGAQPQAPSAFRSQNQVTENVGGSVIPLLQPIRSDDAGEDGSEEDSSPAGRGAQDRGQVAPDRWLLEVRGLASLSIEDADGRRVGPARDPDRLGTVELQIPGVSYTPGLVVNTAFVDRPGPLTVTLTSQIANTVNVYLDLFNVIGNFGTYFFRGVPVAPAGGARLRFDVTDTRPGAFVSDSPAGGEAVVTRPTVLTRDARQTTQPPATSLEINDGMVTVSAVPSSMDNPVARSRVTTDGLTHRIYERPFPVPDDAKVVMAYSEDIAGNLEYPGPARPVLGVSASEVTLADERDVAHVDVLNLDPLRVTGELDCVAEADADWVMLEGGRGATPYTVTVRLADTRPDGAATITVRTGAEGALFAERKVSVKQATTPI